MIKFSSHNVNELFLSFGVFLFVLKFFLILFTLEWRVDCGTSNLDADSRKVLLVCT